MRYRTLGASGCSVSVLALGTMTFGSETDEAGSHAQLDRFLEVGGTFVDTADVYSKTESESIIGRWLAKQSPEILDRVVIATKGRFPTGDGPNDLGLSRRHLSRAIDASLRRLGIECIDLYQVHGFDPLTPIDETLRALDDAVRAGKVNYVGLSNFAAWQVQKVVDVADARNLNPPVTLQPQYNLLAREIEWEIIPVCQSEGLGLLPWSPLGGGWLTGKYRRDQLPTGATRLGEESQSGRRGIRAAQRSRAHLGCLVRPGDHRQGTRVLFSPGGAVLGARPADGELGHPRVPHYRAARRQPGSGGPGSRRTGDRGAGQGQRPRPGPIPLRSSGFTAAQPEGRGGTVELPWSARQCSSLPAASPPFWRSPPLTISVAWTTRC